jgi:hypothetical protein
VLVLPDDLPGFGVASPHCDFLFAEKIVGRGLGTTAALKPTSLVFFEDVDSGRAIGEAGEGDVVLYDIFPILILICD